MYDEIYQRLKKRKMGTWKEYFTFIIMIRFLESINCWAEWNGILFISLLTQPGIVCFGKDLIPNGKHDYFVVFCSTKLKLLSSANVSIVWPKTCLATVQKY